MNNCRGINFDKYRYIVLATNKNNTVIYHMYATKEKPTNEDIICLIKELSQDKEFGMTHLEYEKEYDLRTVALKENETVEEYIENNFVLVDKNEQL